MVALAPASIPVRPRAGLASPGGAAFELFPLLFRAFLTLAAIALFGFFMGFLLNEGLRGFTKTG
jgi:hypothetical protein